MDYQAQTSLPAMLLAQARRLGDRAFLWRKQGGAWHSQSYADAMQQIERLAGGLIGLGVAPGDRIVLVSENRPEWLIADHAIMAAGAITVPAFVTNTTADHLHVLTNSGARGAIVSNRTIAKRLLPAALETPGLEFVVSLEDLAPAQRPPFRLLAWDALLADGAAQRDEVMARVAALRRDDVCCIIYTSGTGGTPRGVMLTHGSILCNCMGAYQVLADFDLGDEVFLSFLPLSHSYEHTAGQFLPVSLGAQIYYAEHVDKLVDDMAEARPTIMTAVPRLYEAMHGRIMRAMSKTTGSKRRLFDAALALGRKKYERPGSLTLGERAMDLVAELLVRRKVRQRFGGRLKALVSG
ncbi:MAG: AMP-dependent synthetase/ligase, partial [Dongiaceae bacterium]